MPPFPRSTPAPSRSWPSRIADLCPLTRRGALLAAVSALGLWQLAFAASDLVIFVAGCAGVLLVLSSVLTVVPAAILVRRRLRSAPVGDIVLETGTRRRTGFQLPALWAIPTLRLSWQWLDPPGVEVGIQPLDRELVEEVVAGRRCLLPAVVRRVAVGDVFGLAEIAWQVSFPTPITIYPLAARVSGVAMLHSLVGGDGWPHPGGPAEGDRLDIRRYAAGDPVRSIMWRAYARTRNLSVRLPERAVAPSIRTAAYLVAGAGDEPAAAVARTAIESGALGTRWLFAADGTEQPTGDRGEALYALARSASRHAAATARAPSQLGRFLTALEREGDCRCVVFAPGQPGAWVTECVELSRRHPSALSFVLGIDGVKRRPLRPVWQRLLASDAETAGVDADELTTLARQIAATGSRVLVVDAACGRSWAQLERTDAGTDP